MKKHLCLQLAVVQCHHCLRLSINHLLSRKQFDGRELSHTCSIPDNVVVVVVDHFGCRLNLAFHANLRGQESVPAGRGTIKCREKLF